MVNTKANRIFILLRAAVIIRMTIRASRVHLLNLIKEFPPAIRHSWVLVAGHPHNMFPPSPAVLLITCLLPVMIILVVEITSKLTRTAMAVCMERILKYCLGYF
jgi:hypothetical protein